jgi:hypothetical protein
VNPAGSDEVTGTSAEEDRRSGAGRAISSRHPGRQRAMRRPSLDQKIESQRDAHGPCGLERRGQAESRVQRDVLGRGDRVRIEAREEVRVGRWGRPRTARDSLVRWRAKVTSRSGRLRRRRASIELDYNAAGISQEGDVARINTGRVVGGGLLAGLIMNIVDTFFNGFLVGLRLQAEGRALNAALMQRPGLTASSFGGWIVVDFLSGILLVWLYAAVAPRFGRGTRTALLAAFMFCFATHLYFASYAFDELYTWGLIVISSVGGLVGALIGAYFGCRVYRDAD